MADSSLSDIICCIGHPVSANPTQYVMERATAAAALDARCLTLDVAPEQLEQAVDGMRAMGFRGAVVASPHETHVRAFLDETRGVAAAHYVDLIYREDGRLIGEATVGTAILTLLQQAGAPPQDLASTNDSSVAATAASPRRMPKTALVIGDGPRALAVAGALSAAGMSTSVVTQEGASDARAAANKEAVADRPADRQIEKGEAPTAAEPSVISPDVPAAVVATKATAQEVAAEPHPGHPLAGPLEQPEPAEKIRFLTQEEVAIGNIGAELVVQARPLLKESHVVLPQPASMMAAVDLTTEPVRTEFLRSAAAAGCVTADSVAVQLQMLIMAFQRWTDVDPDEQIMRDALEEFLLV